jgi:heme/copper-type cytochrome/quinol oxidase subunit 2
LVAEGIRRFNNDRIRVRLGMTGCYAVRWMLVLRRCVRKFAVEVHTRPTRVVHGKRIEVVWTRVPARRWVGIAVPSLTLLYSVDEGLQDGEGSRGRCQSG